MRLFKKWYARLILFLAGFLVLAVLMDLALVPLNPREVLSAYDFSHSEDAEVVAIGNSLCINHINPYKLEEVTGKRAINYGIASTKAQSMVIMATEVFRLKNPEYLLVVYDPQLNVVVQEDTAVMAKFSPVLGSPKLRLQYLLDRMEYSLTDLNRIFLWKTAAELNPKKIAGNILYKLGINQEIAYERSLRQFNAKANRYRGRGYYVINKRHDPNTLEVYAHNVKKEEGTPLKDEVADSFRKVKALCAQNHCQMVVITTPLMRDGVLANGQHRNAMDAMDAFCREEGIPYLNFTYMQGKELPDFTGYYYDGYNHLDAEGLAMFDEPFAQIMKAFFDGEDLSDRFLTKEQWLASIDRVTEVWLTRKKQGKQYSYTAHADCGTMVECEYRFCLVDAEGNETVLQEYDAQKQVKVDPAKQKGSVKAYVRNAANPDQPVLSCMYE